MLVGLPTTTQGMVEWAADGNGDGDGDGNDGDADGSDGGGDGDGDGGDGGCLPEPTGVTPGLVLGFGLTSGPKLWKTQHLT